MKKEKSHNCISFLLTILFLCFFTLNISADEIKPLKGDWKEGKKTSFIKMPVFASIEGSLLTIQCASGRSDITICISNNDGIYYEDTVLASNAYSILIYLTDAPEGEYTLELTNQWGDCVTGNFEIY